MGSLPFPVDAVFTWVDGQDPAWRKRREEALAEERGSLPVQESLDPARFRDNDELKYALRSLERFAPWIRRVHLVVDKQCPAWANAEHLSIVEQKDILPDFARYPLFNSHSIELCLHRVPGVAEHFLAFNDDFMFGAPVTDRDFFTDDGKPRVWLQMKNKAPDPLAPDASSRKRAERRTRLLIQEKYGTYYPHKVKHFPRAYTRNTMELLWEELPEEVRTTLQSRFRHANDFMTHQGYALFLIGTGRGVPLTINGVQKVKDFLFRNIRHLEASLGEKKVARRMREIKFYKPLCFCLNDAPAASDEDHKNLHDFFEEMFPRPSRFEKTGQ